MVSMVLSKLDWGNELVSGLSCDELSKLQKVQLNRVADIMFKKRKIWPCQASF